jgi:hypothetical protein
MKAKEVFRFYSLLCGMIVILYSTCGFSQGQASGGSQAMAQGAYPSAATLNWQKVELEQKLKADIGNAIRGMVGADKYVVNVDVKLRKPPEKPKVVEEVKKPLVDGDPDALLLSKLGILVSAKGDEKKPEVKAPEPEEPLDIFSLLEKIRVSVIIDDSIADDRQEVIKKVIMSQFLQFDPSLVEVNVEKVLLVIPPPPEEKKVEPPPPEKTFIEKFDPFKIPVSIFMSFLTVMAMMLVMFKASGRAPAAGAPGADAAAAGGGATEAKKEEAAAEAAPAVAVGGGHHELSHGPMVAMDSEELKLTIEKFRILLKTNEKGARLLMLEWVNNDSMAAVGALKMLPTYLSLEEFSQMTSDFGVDQRKKLKKIMSVSASELPPATEIMDFVRSQLLASVLSDSKELTEQHKSYLSSLKASEIAGLAKEDQVLASGVVNLVAPELVAQTFNLLDADLVGKVLEQSLTFKVSDFVAQFAMLETKVNDIREKAKVVLAPVLDSVETLLNQVGPDKEGPLFGALISSKAYTMVEELSTRYFPSELVLKLDLPKINSILLKIPLTQRAELIFSLGESERGVVYQAIGEKGKLRELIDSEIESIQTDEVRKKSIEMTRAQIWKSFVNLVRDNVQNNPLVQENAQAVLKAWLDEKRGGAPAEKAAA